jgi:capsular polysaccharide transport system permease protein
MPDKAGPDMDQMPDPALRRVQSPLATPRAVIALILREMSTTYGRSPGGYVWAILEPAAGIALLTAIFSAGFRSPPLGTSFALFYASGMLPFLMFTEISGKLGQTIQFSRALLVYPRVTFLDALVARLLLISLTQIMVHFIVVGFILYFMAPSTLLNFGPIALAYLMTIALAAGIGTLNSFLTLAFPLWQTAWSITTRPLFLVSAIFFTFDSVPQPYSDYLWFNPLVHLVGVMRDGYYPFYHPNYISVAYVMAIAAITGLIGLFLLNRYHRDILDK